MTNDKNVLLVLGVSPSRHSAASMNTCNGANLTAICEDDTLLFRLGRLEILLEETDVNFTLTAGCLGRDNASLVFLGVVDGDEKIGERGDVDLIELNCGEEGEGPSLLCVVVPRDVDLCGRVRQ